MIEEVSPGIFRLEFDLGPRLLALHIFAGERLWLVDTGIASTLTTFPTILASIGRTLEDVAGVVISHPDADHCGGNELFKQLCPRALIVTHTEDASLIASPESCIADRYDFTQPYGFPLETSIRQRLTTTFGEPTPVDIQLHAGATLDLGGRTMQVLHAPGHSDGHLVVFDPAERTLVLGDAVLWKFCPTRDGAPLFAPTYRSRDQYLATIEMVRELRPGLVLGSHLPLIRGEDEMNRFLDESVSFVERTDRLVLDAVERAAAPIALGEIIAEILPDVATWVDPESPTVPFSLAFPVAATLDAFVATGALAVHTTDTVRRYQAA